jgi:LPXTG-motif cell wall-anchored protein
MSLPRKILGMALAALAFGMSAQAVQAAPHFTFTPSSGTYNTGQNFSVVLGVDSETEKVVAMDVVGTFDASKLEIVSIDKVSSPAFNFAWDANTPIIHNDSGRFEITLSPISSSVYDGEVAKGQLLTFNFRPKATGTATLNLTCQTGQIVETNIINQASSDVVNCASNQSGSYTINSTGNDSSPTATPAPNGATTAPSPTSALPQTGGTGSTIGLAVFGVVSILGALFLRVL